MEPHTDVPVVDSGKPVPAAPTLSLKDLAELLVKQNKLHEGLYEIAVELKIAAGAVGPTAEDALPGVIIGVGGITLSHANHLGANVVDASVVNPKPAKRAKKEPANHVSGEAK